MKRSDPQISQITQILFLICVICEICGLSLHIHIIHNPHNRMIDRDERLAEYRQSGWSRFDDRAEPYRGPLI